MTEEQNRILAQLLIVDEAVDVLKLESSKENALDVINQQHIFLDMLKERPILYTEQIIKVESQIDMIDKFLLML